MNVSWFRARPCAAVLTGALVWCVLTLSAAVAQVGQQGATSAAGSAPAQSLEPGDVFLPSSRVYVSVGKTGFGHEHAVVGQLSQGRIRLDVPQNSGQLVFDMRTFVADTNAARQAIGLEGTSDASTQQQVNANMLGPDVLDVAHYPTAAFNVRTVTRLPQPSARGLTQYQLDGDLTLHGVSQPVKIVADTEERNNWIHLRGGFTMLQSRFGITPFTKAFGAIGVADQLTIWGDLWLTKGPQTVAPSTASP